MKVLTRIAALTLLLLAPSACSVPIVTGARMAPEVDVTRPVTFAWDAMETRSSGDPRLANNAFFEDRLHEAVDWQLSLRGFRRTDADPDMRLHYHLSLVDHSMVDEIIDEQGLSRTEVYTYEQGTVVVHITDARTGEDVWVAWAQANIEPALRGPDEMRRWVYDLVSEMFRTWSIPARR